MLTSWSKLSFCNFLWANNLFSSPFLGDSDVLNLASSLASDLAQLVETMSLRSEARQNKNSTASGATGASADSRKGNMVRISNRNETGIFTFVGFYNTQIELFSYEAAWSFTIVAFFSVLGLRLLNKEDLCLKSDSY